MAWQAIRLRLADYHKIIVFHHRTTRQILICLIDYIISFKTTFFNLFFFVFSQYNIKKRTKRRGKPMANKSHPISQQERLFYNKPFPSCKPELIFAEMEG